MYISAVFSVACATHFASGGAMGILSWCKFIPGALR